MWFAPVAIQQDPRCVKDWWHLLEKKMSRVLGDPEIWWEVQNIQKSVANSIFSQAIELKLKVESSSII